MLHFVSVYAEIFINILNACAGIYSNLFHFTICFVLIFTDKFPLAVCPIKKFIQVHLILQFSFALSLFTKIHVWGFVCVMNKISSIYKFVMLSTVYA